MKYVLLIASILISSLASGQSFTFLSPDQAYSSDHASTVGNACGDRISINYRNAFGGAFSNWTGLEVNYDRPFQLKNGDQIGVGLSFNRSNQFVSNHNHGKTMVSYRKSLKTKEGQTEQIVAGIAYQVNQIAYNEDLRWPSQIGPNGFDPTISPTEQLDFLYSTVDVSLGYSLVVSKNQFAHFAATIKSINRPEVSFFSAMPSYVEPSLFFAAYGSTALTDRIYLQPQLQIIRQQDFTHYRVASNFKIEIGQKKNGIIAGVGYNQQKFFSIMLGGEIQQFSVLANYDLLGSSTITEESLSVQLAYRFCK